MLAFWGSFLLSVMIIWLGISRAGYARNFEAWTPNLSRLLLGLIFGFGTFATIYIGLFILKFWLLAVVARILAAALAYKLVS